MDRKKILVTGAAGFIGYHLCEALIKMDYQVVGLDNINEYYDVNLKYSRLQQLGITRKGAEVFINETTSIIHGNQILFVRMNIEDRRALPSLFKEHKFDISFNLAAQAGVRYSIENPEAYIDSNVVGFLNILECCRYNKIEHLLYASSSSVYGENNKVPFSISDNVDHPISLYAATKKSNELMAYTYSHLYNLPTTGLRFFTVYGPYDRPDMALQKFTKAIMNDKPIKVFNYGKHRRDFTYVDDIVEGIIRILDRPALPNPDWDSYNPDPATSSAPYRLYNIGNNNPVELMDYIEALETALGKTAEKELLPLQPGDVPDTYADVDDLVKQFGYKPSMSVGQGVENFAVWYKEYYNE